MGYGSADAGYTASDAILMVRNRTGQTNSQPSDTTILTFLNAGLQNIERRLGAIYTASYQAITAGSNSILLPKDVQSIINLNFSIVLPTATNAILYPIRVVQEGMWERLTGFSPGQSGGYPTLAIITADSSNQITLQLYPVPNVNGYINCYYIQRPLFYPDTTSASLINIDSQVQEAMILYACKNVCEGRAMYGEPVKYFQGLYDQTLETIKEDYALRHNFGPNVVADFTWGAANMPPWYSLES